MRKAGVAAGVFGLLAGVSIADAARWVGPGSFTGPVERPSLYLEAVASLALTQFNLDDLVSGTNVDRRDLGGFGFVTASAGASIVARTAPVAGAEPASSPIALLAAGTSSEAARLNFVMTEPVMSVGFVLMGVESWASLRVHGPGGELIGNYLVPPGLPGERRWIGIAQDDRNISRVQLQPMSPGDYAVDDVELGVHAPEPTALVLWSWVAVPGRRRIRG